MIFKVPSSFHHSMFLCLQVSLCRMQIQRQAADGRHRIRPYLRWQHPADVRRADNRPGPSPARRAAPTGRQPLHGRRRRAGRPHGAGAVPVTRARGGPAPAPSAATAGAAGAVLGVSRHRDNRDRRRRASAMVRSPRHDPTARPQWAGLAARGGERVLAEPCGAARAPGGQPRRRWRAGERGARAVRLSTL